MIKSKAQKRACIAIDKRAQTKYNLGMDVGMKNAGKRMSLLNIPKARLRTLLYGTRVAERVKRRVRLAPFILAAVLAFLLIPFVIMSALREDAVRAEWWTRNIARYFVRVIGALTSWLPISLYEFFIVVLILLGVFLLVRFFINLYSGRLRPIVTGVLALGMCAVYVLDLYMLSMGFGYYRTPMPVPQGSNGYTVEQVITIAEYFLNDYNALAQKFERDKNGCVVNPYGFTGAAVRLKDEFARLDDDYFSAYTPTAKPIVNSWFLSDVLITGVTFLPTGEANLNIAAPPSVITFTTAHELAHTKGVQREGDANILAQYILLSSQDDYFRYCGYYSTFNSFLSAVVLAMGSQTQYAADYNRLLTEIDPLITAERLYAYEYWKSQPDIVGKIGEFFNDLYLKSNGVDNGSGSYNDGNRTEVITPTDPITGEPEKDPDTGDPVYIPVYSTLQKIYFYLYEQNAA